MDEKELAVVIKEIETREKSNVERINRIEDKQDEISEKLGRLPVIEQKQNDMDEKLNRVENLVKDVRDKPGKRWDAVVDKALLAAIGAIILYICSKIGF